MSGTHDFKADGGCACGAVRYRIEQEPLFVHCCHCTWCQRETGSAFVLNALVETDQVTLLSGQTEAVDTPSESGKGQEIHRCPTCQVALWSHFGGAGKNVAFVRVGTLDDPSRCPPDIHLFTRSKQDWVRLDDSKPVMEAFYRYRDLWPEDRFRRLLAAKQRD